MTHSDSLAVPGATLHYEVRGSGPVLAVIGSPMDAEAFAPFADVLAGTYTVVTYDPRGIARSTVEDPEQDSEPDLRADDVAAILDAVGAETADVFGSSGGAVTGLALVTRHPARVRTLVAHEPPLLELLPDAAAQRAKTDENIETFRRHGLEAAWHMFMTNAGFDIGDTGAPVLPDEPSPQRIADSARFFEHEMRPTASYVPQVDALKAGPARIVIGVGADSKRLITYPTSLALAELLGITPVEFPGDHGGFMGAPEEFAKRLIEVLQD